MHKDWRYFFPHCRTLKAAVNELGSCSGHLLLAWFLGPETFSEVSARGLLLTGSHRASIAAVAEGKADFAAIGKGWGWCSWTGFG